MLPSLRLKEPVLVAWSAQGAAVLVTADAIGAFMVSALLITLFGLTGRVNKKIDEQHSGGDCVCAACRQACGVLQPQKLRSGGPSVYNAARATSVVGCAF